MKKQSLFVPCLCCGEEAIESLDLCDSCQSLQESLNDKIDACEDYNFIDWEY